LLRSDERRVPRHDGLSLRNLRYMRAFARAWPAESPSSIVQQPVAQLPWAHNMVILDKLKDADDRSWYASQAVENGWSRKVLQAQIATDLRRRGGSALTSFERTLPAPDSELVRDAIKDPYNFEFLGLSRKAKERDLEQALLNDIQSFLMEMKPALPDLPALASELSNIVEAANAVYDDESTEAEPVSSRHPLTASRTRSDDKHTLFETLAFRPERACRWDEADDRSRANPIARRGAHRAGVGRSQRRRHDRTW